MIKALVFKDHVPPSSSPIWPLLGAGRFLNKTLCPRAKAAALHNSRGVTSITGTHLGQGMPFTRNTLITMQEVLSCRLSIVYNFHPGPENRYGAAFRKEFSKIKAIRAEAKQLGEF